ncbi:MULTISPECIES: type II toxin-antitoxin system death-on-curing family toxin [Pseudomonas]|uniref:type II toxin-antitoxin system death-on-curing family toxin n=1 Tax=Pseudomonas TaxID=286 RepID=UPI0018D68228|nr:MULTISPECIES: type II toxin-antitoxin system death-on-curing family toxin [Pseudomonas]MBH3372908.1 type II toxin-antitoxin system death-on-curing family toxin [Pseudomonas juntendi]MCE1053379.1 type II toxin-antitoxin system death-on-curing family toxin [Pseudomonas alloputida]MDG9807743.1 type II toxin-antitoxin system death-on-curing family toxin [Pseudomonas juntendi]
MDRELVESIHLYLVDHFADSDDPLEPSGVKDYNLLESACARPFQTVHGKDAYETEYEKGAAIFHGIIANHCFHNGNKRTALLSALYYLGENNIWVDRCNDDDMFEFTRQIAAHEIAEKREDEISVIVDWLLRNSRKIMKSDKYLSFNDLREKLGRFDFELSERNALVDVLKDGEIVTRILKKGKHGKEEYDPVYVADLRKRLQLTVDYGVDSGRFYGQKGVSEELNEFMRIRGAVFRRLATA